jgi:anti-sigma factor RsiW
MTEHVDELLALYALGGLESEAVARVEAHLAGCAACRTEAEAMRAVVGALAQSAPAHRPGEAVRARVMQRIGHRSHRPAERPAAARLTWAFAALSAVVIVALLGWNLSLNAQLNRLREQVAAQQKLMGLVTSPTTQAIDLAAPAQPATASGRAYIEATSQTVVVVVQHLRPLDANQTYQAWVIGPGGPVSAGLFAVNAAGWGMTTLTLPYSPGSAIGISREPAGGSAQPTEVVLVGGL